MIYRNGNSGRPVPKPSRQMDSQTRVTRSVAEVTKTKTFRSKTLESRQFCNHGTDSVRDVSNIDAGISLISKWLSLDPYLLAGTMIFIQLYKKKSVLDFFIEHFKEG